MCASKLITFSLGGVLLSPRLAWDCVVEDDLEYLTLCYHISRPGLQASAARPANT